MKHCAVGPSATLNTCSACAGSCAVGLCSTLNTCPVRAGSCACVRFIAATPGAERVAAAQHELPAAGVRCDEVFPEVCLDTGTGGGRDHQERFAAAQHGLPAAGVGEKGGRRQWLLLLAWLPAAGVRWTFFVLGMGVLGMGGKEVPATMAAAEHALRPAWWIKLLGLKHRMARGRGISTGWRGDRVTRTRLQRARCAIPSSLTPRPPRAPSSPPHQFFLQPGLSSALRVLPDAVQGFEAGGRTVGRAAGWSGGQ
eukprot:364628-Chlamydomonas_euryale.AAC.3